MKIRALSSWEVGAVAGVGTALSLLVLAIVYRILSLLVGEILSQLILGLALVVGLSAWFVDWITGKIKQRRVEAITRSNADLADLIAP